MFRLFIDMAFFILKKFIFSVLVIYAFNMIVFPIGIIIPMNFFTIITVMLCGFPFVIGFSLFSLFIV